MDELYKFLEAEYSPKIKSKLNQKLTEFESETDDITLKGIIQNERICMDFHLENGLAKGKFGKMDNTGKHIDIYPNMDLINEDFANYLKSRILKTENPTLKARYAQIIWNHPEFKEFVYLKDTIEAYLLAVPSLIKTQDVESILNLLNLSLKTKYRINEVKNLSLEFLFVDQSDFTYLHFAILSFSIENKLLDKEGFNQAKVLINSMVNGFKEKRNFLLAELTIGLGEKISNKQHEDIKPWKRMRGILKMLESKERMDDPTKMIPAKFISEAITFFQEAKDEVKLEEARQKYLEIKDQILLSNVNIPIDPQDFEILDSVNNARIDSLLSQSSDHVYSYLAQNNDYLPRKSFLISESENSTSSLLNFVTQISFDINKNLSVNVGENKESQKFKNYGLFMSLQGSLFLNSLFSQGANKGILGIESLVSYLSKHSWLAQEFEISNTVGEVKLHNWLSLILPSLLDFFLQIETSEKIGKSFYNLVSPIDSLTIKFEGIFRDLIKLLGGTTTISKREVLQEQTFEELLSNSKIVELLSEEDRTFYEYLFTRKGLNLRNNIAHGFFRYFDYSFSIMILLIIGILRISRFKLES